MNKINGQSYNEFTFNAALKQIDKVIKLAGQYDGRCYGPYVRNVLIPKLSNPSAVCEYNEVHLEFPTYDQEKLFWENIISKYGEMRSFNVFTLKIQDMFIAELIIDQYKPNSNVFNVNALTYLYKDSFQYYDENALVYYNKSNVLESPLAQCILEKQMSLRLDILKNNKFIAQGFIDNLNVIISKGWTIRFGTMVQTVPFEKTQFEKDIQSMVVDKVNIMDEFKKAYHLAYEAITKRDALFNQCIVEYKLLETTDCALKELMMKALCQ